MEKTVLIISGYDDYSIKVWDLSDESLIFTIRENAGFTSIAAFNYSHNGQIISANLSDPDGQYTQFLDVSSGNLVYTMQDTICRLFTPDGRYVICNPGMNSTFGLYGIKE